MGMSQESREETAVRRRKSCVSVVNSDEEEGPHTKHTNGLCACKQEVEVNWVYLLLPVWSGLCL